MAIATQSDRGTVKAGSEEEDLDELFREIWERESQQELRFPIPGIGQVIQTQDLAGQRWEVQNFSNTVWEAAIWMHYFFQDERCFPPGWLRGRRVLELGAGTGLVGLTLALLGAEVTMTDLAEALPILGHNMDATLGCAAAESGDNMKPHLRSDGDVGGRCHGEGGGLPNGKARRPVIQQLRWGNSTDALEVGKLAGAAARAEGREAFDIIVGADVIYNETTFEALISTLTNDHLCSDTTLIYLATRLRGGRHEVFLDKIANNFHVRALENPTHANNLRTRVDAGEDWSGAECDSLGETHREGVRELPENTSVVEATCWGSAGDSTERLNVRGGNDGKKKHTRGGGNSSVCKNYRSGTLGSTHEAICYCTFKHHYETCPTPLVAKEEVGSMKDGQSKNCHCISYCPSCRGDVNNVRNRKGEWLYEISGDLGTVLAFAARRRA